MALSEASKEAAYLRRFFEELGIGADGPTSLSTDNSAARDLSYNPEHHEQTKHIERRHFYIRELVENGDLVVPLVSTVDNYSDFFTKALKPPAFYKFRNLIMNVDPERCRADSSTGGGSSEHGGVSESGPLGSALP